MGDGNADSGAVKDLGKPCAGEPHARFDERGLETGHGHGTAAPAKIMRGQRRTYRPPRQPPTLPRRQSLLRSQARYALLPAATPRERRFAPARTPIIPRDPLLLNRGRQATSPDRRAMRVLAAGAKRPSRGVAAGRSAQRACERSSDWRRGAAGSPDPYYDTARNFAGSSDSYDFTADPYDFRADPYYVLSPTVRLMVRLCVDPWRSGQTSCRTDWRGRRF